MRNLRWWPAAALLAVVGASAAGLLFVRSQLPPIYTLADYRPPEASQVFSNDGQLVATFATERRSVVDFAAIPAHVVHAFLAAEDAGFYAHEGIDWPGVARALLKNLRPGAHLQGASTITQQTVKALILGPERSLWRKVREALLARRLEQMLGKDAILAIYLNQIYFGSGAWGVQQAALTYFGKPVQDLDLAEGALLAAAPKNPRRYTLRGDLPALKTRQRYVLRQMLAHGWVDAATAQAAIDAPLPALPAPSPYVAAAASYVEQARRQLVAELGEAQVHEGGLKIYLGLHAGQQAAAAAALRQSVEDVARRHGYPGASRRLEVNELHERLRQAHAAWDRPAARPCLGCRAAQEMWDFSAATPRPQAGERWARELGRVALLPYERAEVPVLAVHRATGEAVVDLGSQHARLPLRRMAWARPFAPLGASPRPTWAGAALHPGDLVTVDVVRLGRPGTPEALAEVALVPPTRLEGALVAIDPHTRLVTALLGSVRPETAVGFNRATQAHRQPGSAFKPLIYAAGLLTQTITPASTCNDAPISIVDPWTGAAWRPENYEDGRYDGPITYRQALTLSKNTCSVRLLQRMGPAQAIALAHAMGIDEALPENLTLALGTGELTPLALTNAMATLAAGGAYAPPRLVRRVLAADGRELVADVVAPTQQVLPPEVAYVLTDMLQGVVQHGTARRARLLERPLAGKTGTSQAARDVWFTGYSPSLAATTWLGFDDNASLGRQTGGSAALPAWIRFMGVALAATPAEAFYRPPNVVTVRVDPHTGQPSAEPTAVDEIFVAGTEPAAAPAQLPSIFLEDEHAPLGSHTAPRAAPAGAVAPGPVSPAASSPVPPGAGDPASADGGARPAPVGPGPVDAADAEAAADADADLDAETDQDLDADADAGAGADDAPRFGPVPAKRP